MTYLLSQIFISLLLAAIAGGAIGWISRGLKAQRRERDLDGLLSRHASALAQAQQERQMIADDYDEMQLGLESRIGELQVESRKIPELRDNLENSQQLLQQMMKKHESETAELQQQGELLKLELDSLRVQQKNDHSEIAALRKTNSELGGSNSQFESVAQPAASDQIRPAAERKAQQTSTATDGDNASSSKITTQTNPQPQAQTGESFQRAHGRAHHTRINEPVDHTEAIAGSSIGNQTDRSINPDEKLRQTQASEQAVDDLSDIIGESSDRAAVTQAELLELESEIEEMRGYNRDHGFPSAQDHLPGAKTAATAASASAAGLTASTNKMTTHGNQPAASATLSSQDPIDKKTIADNLPSSNANPEASAVAELRQHFSAGGDPEAIDDLQTIHGIGPVMEKSLNEIGITNYHQIAELTRREIEDIAEILEIFPGRIERDNWIGSARKLAGDSSTQTTDNKETEAHKEAGKPALHAEEV